MFLSFRSPSIMTLAAIVAVLATARPLSAQVDHAHGADAPDRLGVITFPISCDAPAQQRFARGVALLHHMMYEQAREEFGSVAELDPECAMAHWGTAMTLFQPLWPGQPSPEALDRGWAAVERARALEPKTERESAYIAAAAAFYRDPQGRDYRARLRAFEAAMKRVHEANPQDAEAAAFYALSHLATASPSDKSLAHQRAAAAVLGGIHEEQPTHPGAIHYAIHAHDLPSLATRAVAVARSYDRIAPSVPHALHMPTHIFVRLGHWPDVIQWNRRSADAALEQPAGEWVSHHYPHALDYLMYAYLQRAEDGKARAVLGEIRDRQGLQQTFVSAYALAAVPARFTLERGEWAEAMALPERAPDSFPWERFPGAEAITHFARGIGAARSGSPAAAREALAKLDRLKASAAGAGDDYWAEQIEIQRRAVAAWAAHAEGDVAEALDLMRAAAALEEATEKHPVTPGSILPARELLGELLLELDRPEDALRAFEATLRDNPNRARSLFGAGRAAELAGDLPTARERFTAFLTLLEAAEGERPEVAVARSFLGRR